MKQKIVFIIVAYYPDKRIFRRLLQTINAYPTIIVDNGAVGEVKLPNVEILRNLRNIGYGAGANVGILKALTEGGNWMVILNQDIVISKKDVKKFISQLKIARPGIMGIVQGVLDSRRWTTILDEKAVGQIYVSGSLIAIHRDVINEVGFFYEKYFLYYEDTELCIRAKNAGFTLNSISLPSFKHKESQTLGRVSYEHQYYLARNHLLFVERCAPWNIKLYELIRLPKTIVDHIKNNERGSYRGVLDYLLRRFGPI